MLQMPQVTLDMGEAIMDCDKQQENGDCVADGDCDNGYIVHKMRAVSAISWFMRRLCAGRMRKSIACSLVLLAWSVQGQRYTLDTSLIGIWFFARPHVLSARRAIKELKSEFYHRRQYALKPPDDICESAVVVGRGGYQHAEQKPGANP